jgi:ATP adenylyltransferase
MWAPWRMSYIAAEHDHGYEGPACVFCDMLSRTDDAAAYVLHRGRAAFVVMNLYPYNNGHVMIVPHAHVDSLRALPADVPAEIMELTRLTQGVIEERMRPHGFNLGMNQGRAAGAGIADHLHLHLVPRWSGDTNFMPVTADVRVIPDHLDATYALLRAGFGS